MEPARDGAKSLHSSAQLVVRCRSSKLARYHFVVKYGITVGLTCYIHLHYISITSVLVTAGAGPHPKAVSGRVICCTWWLFAVVVLACYFSSLSSSQGSDSAPLMIKGFDDLANQEVMEYGTLAGSSTLAFFKVGSDAYIFLISQNLPHVKILSFHTEL